MKNTTKQKIKKLVEEESIDWLLNQFAGEEDEIFVSGALKELFEDKGIEISSESLKYIVELYIGQPDEELYKADE